MKWGGLLKKSKKEKSPRGAFITRMLQWSKFNFVKKGRPSFFSTLLSLPIKAHKTAWKVMLSLPPSLVVCSRWNCTTTRFSFLKFCWGESWVTTRVVREEGELEKKSSIENAATTSSTEERKKEGWFEAQSTVKRALLPHPISPLFSKVKLNRWRFETVQKSKWFIFWRGRTFCGKGASDIGVFRCKFAKVWTPKEQLEEPKFCNSICACFGSKIWRLRERSRWNTCQTWGQNKNSVSLFFWSKSVSSPAAQKLWSHLRMFETFLARVYFNQFSLSARRGSNFECFVRSGVRTLASNSIWRVIEAKFWTKASACVKSRDFYIPVFILGYGGKGTERDPWPAQWEQIFWPPRKWSNLIIYISQYLA